MIAGTKNLQDWQGIKMQISVDSSVFDIVSKMKNLANNDIKTFRTQLDKIRTSLNNAYCGKADISSEIQVFEKKIDAFLAKVLSLAAAFDHGVSDVLESANRTIKIGELAPLSRELDFILSDPTTAQIIEHNQKILLARSYTEKYKNSILLTSSLSKMIVGGLLGGASTLALLPLINTDSSDEGIDAWFKEYYPDEYDAAKDDYIGYRQKVETLQTRFPNGQTQVYAINASGQSIGGRCNVAAMQRLLDRKCVLDGNPINTFTVEDVIHGSGGRIIPNAHNGQHPTNKNSGIGYQYSGTTGRVKSSKYTKGNVSYQAKVGASSFASLDECNASLVSLLNQHPEGLYIHMNNGGGKEHAIVLTDYTVDDNGTVTYYFSDSWGANNSGAAPHNLISQVSMNGKKGSLGTKVDENNWYKFIDTVSYLE